MGSNPIPRILLLTASFIDPTSVFDGQVRRLRGLDLRIHEPVLLLAPDLGWLLADVLDPALDGLDALLSVPFVFIRQRIRLA